MENRFKKRKKPNYKRAFLLIVALVLIILLWYNAEAIITNLFDTKR